MAKKRYICSIGADGSENWLIFNYSAYKKRLRSQIWYQHREGGPSCIDLGYEQFEKNDQRNRRYGPNEYHSNGYERDEFYVDFRHSLKYIWLTEHPDLSYDDFAKTDTFRRKILKIEH